MAIWSAEIKELEKLYESLKGQLPDLEKELERLVKADDENMILLYARRCLEVIITDLCECELKRPRKTEPLQGIIDKLHKEDKVPSHIISSMHGLNELSTYGAHPKDFDPRQVRTTLINLETIIEWHLKHKEGGAKVVARSAEKVRLEVKSTEEVKKRIQIPRKRLISFITGSVLLIVIVFAVLFFTNIIGGGKELQEIEKSIAVLPFRNDTRDSTNQYFIDGIMEEILNGLQKIGAFSRVLSRNSVEQFRNNTTKSTPEIAKALNVNFIVEGSGQKYGNKFVLRVQLVTGKNERHLWAKSYDREIMQTTDIISVQSEIAQLIAAELKATITPEEKQLIEKTPTGNLTALDFYQRGRDELTKYWIDNDNKVALGKATDFYHKALEYDSTFAQAYTGLAWVYWNKHYWSEYFSENFQDSTLSLTNTALSFDDQLSEAYTLKGIYYSEIGKREQAIEEFDKAIKYNPNDWIAYLGKGGLYLGNDLVNNINYLQKAASLNHGGPTLPSILREIGSSYFTAGFPEKCKYYYQEALKLDDDLASYYSNSAMLEFWLGNFNEALELALKGYAIDSTNTLILEYLPDIYLSLRQDKESLIYLKKYIEKLKILGYLKINGTQRIGYVYWRTGYKEEAEYYINEQKRYCEESIKMGRSYANNLFAYYDLAGVNAFMGEKEKAYVNLRIWARGPVCSLMMLNLFKTDPFFDSIRNEPEFQQIAKDVEAKYQEEHERVRKWLEGQGML